MSAWLVGGSVWGQHNRSKEMHMRTHTRHTALAVLAALGMGSALLAQPPSDKPDHDGRKDGAQPDRSTMSDRPMQFVSGKKIHGLTVKNGEDKSIVSIDDMIIDQGSGRIQYLVLKSGSILGMGGKLVTVPYKSFGWSNVEKDATLNATTDQIKTWPEFDKKRWEEGPRTSDSYMRVIGKDYYQTTNAPWPAEMASDRQTTSYTGTIKSIRRHDIDGQEETIVVVASPGKPDRDIVMGPSWYFAGNNSVAFYRDAPIDVDVYQMDRNGHTTYLARTAKVNGKTVAIYDTKGNAYWTPPAMTDTSAYAVSPFILYSEVKGKHVDARGEKCGKVEDVIVDCVNGRAVFLSIDPDKNVLGIGDEDRLVPWTLTSRSSDGMIHIDASKTMITSASPTPKDLNSLNNDYKRIYSSYDTEPAWDRSRR
jgi:sporulation protein YlmC with PRC-barrel domain